MLIRKQDIVIIQQVSLLGAVLSGLILGYFIWELPTQARESFSRQNDQLRQAAAIDKLTNAMADQTKVAESISKGLSVLNSCNEEITTQTSFWAGLPLGKQIGLSVAAAVGGGAAVYGIIYGSMWMGSALLYILIRKIYLILGDIMPEYAGAEKSDVFVNGKLNLQRNPNRLLPLAIKLFFLLFLTLILLGLVVWQITNMKN